jgi:hypothetical protein
MAPKILLKIVPLNMPSARSHLPLEVSKPQKHMLLLALQVFYTQSSLFFLRSGVI